MARNTALNIVTLLALVATPFVGAQSPGDAKPSTTTAHAKPEELVGTWQVTLLDGRGEPVDTTTMVIKQAESDQLKGTFYGSDMSEARFLVVKGLLTGAFETRDGSGPYFSSMTFDGRRLHGVTNSTGRDFLTLWTAKRTNTASHEPRE